MSELVELAGYPNRVEADLARLVLENEGIYAVLFDTETSNFYGFFAAPFMPIRLMVLDDDYEAAREVLEKDRA